MMITWWRMVVTTSRLQRMPRKASPISSRTQETTLAVKYQNDDVAKEEICSQLSHCLIISGETICGRSGSVSNPPGNSVPCSQWLILKCWRSPLWLQSTACAWRLKNHYLGNELQKRSYSKRLLMEIPRDFQKGCKNVQGELTHHHLREVILRQQCSFFNIVQIVQILPSI